MERVQITGGSNGVYTDTKGRHLYTMGDYSPAVGEWVWTNGTTIYGHQHSGGEQVSKIDTAVLSVPIKKIEDDGHESNFLRKLQANGKVSKFVESGIDTISYINDASHAYLQTNDGDWYNIITGDYLGNFFASYVTLDKDGNLLTILASNGGYSDFLSKKELSYWTVPVYSRYVFRRNEEDGEDGLDRKGGYIHRKAPLAAESSISRKNAFIVIRRNGKITRFIDLAGYLSNAMNKVGNESKKIHNRGDASGKDVWSEAEYPRPQSYVRFADVDCSSAYITPEGEFALNIHVSAVADAFPWVTVKGADGEKVRYWLRDVEVAYNASYICKNGDISLTYESFWKTMLGGSYPAPVIKKESYDKQKSNEDKSTKFTVIKGENFTGVLWTDTEYVFTDDKGNKYYNRYYVFGNKWNYYPGSDGEDTATKFTSEGDADICRNGMIDTWIKMGLTQSINILRWGAGQLVYYESWGNKFHAKYNYNNGDFQLLDNTTGKVIFSYKGGSLVSSYFRIDPFFAQVRKSGHGYWICQGNAFLIYVLDGEIIFYTNYGPQGMSSYILTTQLWSLSPFKNARKLKKCMLRLAGKLLEAE